MLLETKNIKENDIIIYTRNSMDENYNFRIVFKNDPHTHHRIISFEHVKKLITADFPKNLIAYRILCNLPDITLSNVRYGCVVMANGEPELIFTDPVFAVQTIEEYIQYNHNNKFRFSIQQVGYTTLNQAEGKANFKEEFVFDLKMDEAINQNDEIFAMPLLDKRITSRIRKKSGSEIKRNLIFKPENQNKLGFIEEDIKLAKTKREVVDQELSKRYEREAEGEKTHAGNRLILGKIERLQAEKKQIQFPFLNERRISIEDDRVTETSRNFQQKQRKPLEEEKLKKVKSSEPEIIRRVEINENGSETPMEVIKTKNHKDDLFSDFLINLQSESISNINRKKKRYKESDIIQMFKSVQTANLKKDGDQKNNIVLKANKKGKRR